MKSEIMPTDIQHYLVKNGMKDWLPLVESGAHYEGVFVIALHFDDVKQRATTILLKFEAGASYPYHNHPGGEEIYVLKGELIFDDVAMQEGDYLYTPPGFKHKVASKTGATALVVVPEEVEILN